MQPCTTRIIVFLLTLMAMPLPSQAMDERVTQDRVAEATSRLVALAPKAVWVQMGPGDQVREASDLLKENLRQKHIPLATVTKTHGVPMPAGDGAGGHVHSVDYHWEPRPSHVVFISESAGVITISACLVKGDPFGPPGACLWALPEDTNSGERVAK
jgi:hypothetical protein